MQCPDVSEIPGLDDSLEKAVDLEASEGSFWNVTTASKIRFGRLSKSAALLRLHRDHTSNIRAESSNSVPFKNRVILPSARFVLTRGCRGEPFVAMLTYKLPVESTNASQSLPHLSFVPPLPPVHDYELLRAPRLGIT